MIRVQRFWGDDELQGYLADDPMRRQGNKLSGLPRHQLDTGGRYIDLRSGRIGRNRIRTFHCDFRSVKVAGDAAAPVDYLAREGDYTDRDDLESLAGDPDAVKSATAAVDEAATKRRGKTAERVLLTGVFDLPAETSFQGREEIARRIVEDWQSRGHAAVAAVHGHGRVQPHLHFAVTARPVIRRPDGSGWDVDRTPCNRLLVGKGAMRAERRRIARIVNETVGREIFHGGRLADTGIEREAKRRVPERLFHENDQREIDADVAAKRRDEHTETRRQESERRRQRRREKDAKAQAALRRLNGIERKEYVEVAVAHARAEERADRAERAFKEATDRQIWRAKKELADAGFRLSEEEMHRLDGGDLMGFVKAVRASDATKAAAALSAAQARAHAEGRRATKAEAKTDKQLEFIRILAVEAGIEISDSEIEAITANALIERLKIAKAERRRVAGTASPDRQSTSPQREEKMERPVHQLVAELLKARQIGDKALEKSLLEELDRLVGTEERLRLIADAEAKRKSEDEKRKAASGWPKDLPWGLGVRVSNTIAGRSPDEWRSRLRALSDADLDATYRLTNKAAKSAPNHVERSHASQGRVLIEQEFRRRERGEPDEHTQLRQKPRQRDDDEWDR